MSLFDFLMPEVAQASHLRQIADSASLANTQSRLQSARVAHKEQTSSRRIQELESEVGQLTIVVEALLECLEDSKAISKEEVAKKIGDIDARDGVIDGRKTKREKEQNSDTISKPKLHIPKS